MPQEEKIPKFAILKSLFLDGSIKSMKDIKELYPTYIGKKLGLNHSRYIEKLNNPEMFKIQHIITFARMIDINPQIIMTIILNQIATEEKKKTTRKKLG